ncbi:MAG: cupin domain-containing protein [Candidatus Acidiferrales bacterium]
MVGSTAVTSPAWASPLTAGQFSKSNESREVFLPPGSGRKGKVSANDITFKFDKSQTSGHLGSAELILYPGMMGAAPHFHHSFDEICGVMEGTVTVMVGEKVTDLPAGAWHLRPKGQVHSFWNSGKVPSRAVELYIPGGHEEFMKALTEIFAKSERPPRDEIENLGKKYDTTFVWERLPQILEKYGVRL